VKTQDERPQTLLIEGRFSFSAILAQFNGGSSVHLSHDTPAMHGNGDFAHTEH